MLSPRVTTGKTHRKRLNCAYYVLCLPSPVGHACQAQDGCQHSGLDRFLFAVTYTIERDCGC